MPQVQSEQRTEAWLAARVGIITASVAAGCLGLHPYMSRAKAWRLILGTEKTEENRFMRWGTEMEASARGQYEVETGVLVWPTGFWVHPEHPWLGASPDGLIGTDGLAECKCPQSLPEAVPLHHRIQMLVQLAVTGREWCDYYAWTLHGSFLRRVRPAGIGGLIRRLDEFRRAYLLTNTEPPRKRRKS